MEAKGWVEKSDEISVFSFGVNDDSKKFETEIYKKFPVKRKNSLCCFGLWCFLRAKFPRAKNLKKFQSTLLESKTHYEFYQIFMLPLSANKVQHFVNKENSSYFLLH